MGSAGASNSSLTSPMLLLAVSMTELAASETALAAASEGSPANCFETVSPRTLSGTSARVVEEPWGVYEREVELPTPFCDKVAEVEGKLSARSVTTERYSKVRILESDWKKLRNKLIYLF
jgi:hypothetical protein